MSGSTSQSEPDDAGKGPDNLVTGAQSNNSDDDDEVWDPAAEKHPREPSSKAQDKTTSTAPPSSDWQAIWSAAHGAYYFYNTTTKETTWINPLVPPTASDAPESTTTTTTSDATAPGNPSSSSGDSSTSPPSQSAQQQPSSSSSSPSTFQQQQPSTTITASSFLSPSPHPTLPTSAQLGGIDPELAFLDPSLAYTSGGPNKDKGINTTGPVPTFTAKFNARSGRFAGGDARDPNHVSEYERAKRMSQAYFDVDSWGKQVEEREDARKRAAEQGEDPNAKRKKPTKADLERFREQKKEKKMRKIAWLRE